jgi:hypothetical protein
MNLYIYIYDSYNKQFSNNYCLYKIKMIYFMNLIINVNNILYKYQTNIFLD